MYSERVVVLIGICYSKRLWKLHGSQLEPSTEREPRSHGTNWKANADEAHAKMMQDQSIGKLMTEFDGQLPKEKSHRG